MGQLVFILGRSGTGKSFSMRNFDKGKLAVINVQGKILPFKGGAAVEQLNTDQSEKIVIAIKNYAKTYKSIVVDDFQYVMANEFMRRATERGFDKFTEIARHAWDIADCVRNLPEDVIVYVMCHTDTDTEGTERLKTIGKLLDEKICLEGMSTIVLKTNVSDGQYSFLTQNNGKDTVKSPMGMFPSYAIDNDLKYVDEKIRNYFELGEFLTDDEIAEIDEAAKKVDVIKEDTTTKKRRGRKAAEPTPTVTPTEEENTTELPKRKNRKTVEKVIDENIEKYNNETPVEDDPDELPSWAVPGKEETPVETAEAAPTRRRRRRSE